MVMSPSLIDAVKARTTDEAARDAYPEGFPVLPAVPAARYRDPEFAQLEDDAVWRRSWLFVAHADQLRQPGDYLVVDQLDVPLILVRGDEGTVRAFFNTCTHRGSALVLDDHGSVGRRITCPYHAWVYDLSGRLVGFPEASNFCDLDRDCHSLTPVRCESWGPFVFVNLDRHAPPLREFLGSVGDDLSEIDALDGRLHLAGTTTREVPVNWKVPVDANIETYHVSYVHRNTAGKALRQAATGIQLLRNGHSRMLICVQEGIDIAGNLPFPSLFDGIGDLPASGTFSYHVFPNLSIVFAGSGFLFLITNWPTGASTSTYRVHWCSSLPPDDEASRQTNDTFIGFNSAVLFEDLSVLPSVQRSIDAGAIDFLRLSYQERRIYHVHEAIDRAIGAERIPEPLRVPQVLGPFIEE